MKSCDACYESGFILSVLFVALLILGTWKALEIIYFVGSHVQFKP